MNDRIKLAEANRELANQRVILAKVIWPDKDIYQIERSRDDGGFVGYNYPNGTFHNFNPFTDANDDYAVLEWMRENDKLDSDNFDLHYQWNYQVGDYARAALKALS